MISRIALISTVAIAGSAFAQEAPDRNPEQNPDGSKTYWTGNNMQWDTQEAIDDCNPGDIIVIRGGSYVNSLTVNKPNITIRPFCADVNGVATWEEVELWGPTQGPEAQNGWNVYVGPNTENVYIGEPRQFRELSSGYVSENTIVPNEYFGTGSPVEVDDVAGFAIRYWSRSVDNTSVMSDSGKATIQKSTFTSENGFGGACVLVGADNDTSFIDCTFDGLYANGTTLRTDVPGLAVENYCISIISSGGMEPTFSDCTISNNRGETIVYQNGGGGNFNDCDFDLNTADVNFAGVVTLLGTTTNFNNCAFRDNVSGYGTVFMNGEGGSNIDPVRFTNCAFRRNTTIDGQWGGVIYAIDSKAATGTAPKVMFDSCQLTNNNGAGGGSEINQEDFVTPYFPTYRQGDQNENALASEEPDVCTPSADLNGDGVVDGADLGIIFASWGTDGTL